MDSHIPVGSFVKDKGLFPWSQNPVATSALVPHAQTSTTTLHPWTLGLRQAQQKLQSPNLLFQQLPCPVAQVSHPSHLHPLPGPVST